MQRCAAVLVNYFGAADIALAVQSILRDAADCQILVLDNSADAAEFARLTERLPTSVQLIDNHANLGFGPACNRAWEMTQTPFVFFVNPDVRVQSGCINTLLNALEDDPGWAAVAPQQFLDPACQWHLPPAWLPTALRAWTHAMAAHHPTAARRLARAQRAENLRLWEAQQPLAQRALSGGALMLRRSALADGELPFDPRFFMYFEDSDLCLRLRRRSQRVAVVPAARAVHAWRNLPHKAPLMERSAQVFFDKHWPAPQRYWLDKAEALGTTPAQPGGWAHQPCNTPVVTVPSHWQNAWLLELSPSPLIQPAIGFFGAGPTATLPQEVRASFCGASVFGRLSALPLNTTEAALWLRWC